MTEKEKMLRGMLYAPAHDETLLAELAACKAQWPAVQSAGLSGGGHRIRPDAAAPAAGRPLGKDCGLSRPSGATTAGISVWAGTST